MFLGCPLRMVLRLGGGDLNAVMGLVGFIIGIFVGTLFPVSYTHLWGRIRGSRYWEGTVDAAMDSAPWISEEAFFTSCSARSHRPRIWVA